MNFYSTLKPILAQQKHAVEHPMKACCSDVTLTVERDGPTENLTSQKSWHLAPHSEIPTQTNHFIPSSLLVVSSSIANVGCKS